MSKLYRSHNKVIAGVVAGIAEKVGMSVLALRIITLILTIATGFFPIPVIYIILWIFVPSKG